MARHLPVKQCSSGLDTHGSPQFYASTTGAVHLVAHGCKFGGVVQDLHSRNRGVWLIPFASEAKARWFESNFLDHFKDYCRVNLSESKGICAQ